MCLLLVVLGWSTPLPPQWTPWSEQALSLVGIMGAPILGGLIASRRPYNSYGWLWLGLGLSFALMQFGQTYATYALIAKPGSLPAPRELGTVLGQGFVAAMVMLPFVFLLFPDGHLPSPRWRLVAWVTVLVGAPLLIAPPFVSSEGGIVPVENPMALGGSSSKAVSALIDPGILVLFILIVLSVLSLVFRYLRTTGIQRQQIKWFAYAAALNGCLVLFDVLGLSDLLLRYSFGYVLWTHLGNLALAALYVAVGFAVLRYRLYDVDVLINRTLVYGALTAALAAVYLASVTTTQAISRPLTGEIGQSQLTIVVSTLVIAALFTPLRRRTQSFIDKRFYRKKYDARKIVDAFSATLRDETNLERLGDHLTGVVGEALHPKHASLWLHPESTPKGEGRDT